MFLAVCHQLYSGNEASIALNQLKIHKLSQVHPLKIVYLCPFRRRGALGAPITTANGISKSITSALYTVKNKWKINSRVNSVEKTKRSTSDNPADAL